MIQLNSVNDCYYLVLKLQHSANLLIAKIPIFYITMLTTKAKKTELVYFVKTIYSNVLLSLLLFDE